MAKFSFRNTFFNRNNDTIKNTVQNKFNQAFFWGSLGSQVINDDKDLKRYIDYSYNINPDVYSVVNQIANKFTSIPYVIRPIKDKEANKKLQRLNTATKYNYTIAQEVKAYDLKEKAFGVDEGLLPMPLDKPNPQQSWTEFFTLSETFLNTTGNIYWYMVKPREGMNKGVPNSIYVLPSHLIEIVLKDNADFLTLESPIDHFSLIEGVQYTDFKAEDVIHIKYPNPNYNQDGSHLYGQSPLRAGYKNIEMTNKGLDLSANTLKNGGAFGFIHAKDSQTPLSNEQATGVKSRLKEMNNNPEDLGRIGAISQSIGFTRISLTTDELKPFEYFKYNLKQVCNVLGWDDKLLNSDDGAKYDNMTIAEKRVVTGKIVPDIKLYEQALNHFFIPLFKGYENTKIDFLVKELPEMQQDMKTLVEWIEKVVNMGLITRNKALKIMGMPQNEDVNMDLITVKDDIMTLADALLPQDDVQI